MINKCGYFSLKAFLNYSSANCNKRRSQSVYIGMSMTSRTYREAADIDLRAESIADELLREAAAAQRTSPERLLDRLQRDASLDAHANCLQPYELETLNELTEDRRSHVQGCSFCQVLIEGATPSYEQASRYAAEAVRITKTSPATKASSRRRLIEECG